MKARSQIRGAQVRLLAAGRGAYDSKGCQRLLRHIKLL